MKKIGFIGLGIMGKNMAKNLIKAGHSLKVYDINHSAVSDLVAAGAADGKTIANTASDCNILITMLPNSPQVKEVVLGSGGVIETIKSPTIFIDMSSIAPMASQEIGEALAEKGVKMIDAPVSGGEPKAIDGTLSIMCGGDEEVFEQVKDVLLAMGASAVLVGGIGSGNVTKLANQIIVALNIAAVSEGLVFASKAGVNPEKVYQAIRGGLAGSTVMDAKVPMALARNFKPGFRVALHIKDLANAIDTGHEVGMPLPLTAMIMEILQALKVDGKGSDDHSSIIQHYEKLAQKTIIE